MNKRIRRLGYIIGSPFRWVRKSYTDVKTFINEEPEDTPLPEVVAKTVNDLDGVFFHLNALRVRLMWSLFFLAITTVISFIFTSRIIDFLALPVGGLAKLQAIDVTEPIGVFMKVALLSGFALALPFISFQLWLFIAPGLSRSSRIGSLFAIPLVVVFFIGGMAFAYFVMMPTALKFLLTFNGMTTVPRPSSYISFVTSLVFWVGIAFEFPFVIYLLAALRLIPAKVLAQQWRVAIVLIAILSAAITPTVDPVNMSLVMGPMILLYFLSIGLAFIAQREKKEKKEIQAEGVK